MVRVLPVVQEYQALHHIQVDLLHPTTKEWFYNDIICTFTFVNINYGLSYCEEKSLLFLTGLPLGPESPLYPGAPGGPCK